MSNQASDPEAEDSAQPLDSAVTPELFRQWRSPRLGTTNPERMDNPVWEWLVRCRISAFQASERFDGPDAFEAGPGWCFDRFGQSSTQLADGRLVLIGGEHEDYYDPDFYIYNDVVVQHPDGRTAIFGYPREAFPPTDHHSATLVGNRIVILGNLGYPADRKPGTTQVRVLDLESWSIASVRTEGSPPGWISKHLAALPEDERSILVQRGEVDCGREDRSLIENIDDWRLHLAGWRWERLTDRRWPRWEVRRKDGKLNHLWRIRSAAWLRGRVCFEKEFREAMEQLTEELGTPPDLDLYERRYDSGIAAERLPPLEDEHGVHRVRINGVVVRYVESLHSIQMTVEGNLPLQMIKALVRDLADKLSALENAACEWHELRS